ALAPSGLAAHQLQRADDGSRASELIEREKAQRVPHQHRNACTEFAAIREAPMRNRPGGEAEIGLGFATSGRKEEQIDSLAIGVQRIMETGKIKKDEGELERAPFGSVLAGWIVAVPRRALAIGAGNRLIHGAKGKARVRIAR